MWKSGDRDKRCIEIKPARREARRRLVRTSQELSLGGGRSDVVLGEQSVRPETRRARTSHEQPRLDRVVAPHLSTVHVGMLH